MEYKDKTITRIGASLMAQSDANQETTVIDNIVVSDQPQNINDSSDLKDLTIENFGNYQSLDIKRIRHNDNTFQPEAIFYNDELEKDFSIELVGLIGHNSNQNKVLIAVAKASEPFVLQHSTNTPFNITISMPVSYANASNVTAKIIEPGTITDTDLNKTTEDLKLIIKNNKADLQKNIDAKASIEQAQYSVIRELTDEDDLYHIDKNGRYLGNGINPKNSPFNDKSWFIFEKNNFYAMFTDNGGDRFIVADYSKGWIKIPNQNDMNQQYQQTKSLFKTKFSWNAKQDAQNDPEPHIYKSQKDNVGFYQGGGIGTILDGTLEVQQDALKNVNLNDVTKNGFYFIRGNNDVGSMPGGASNYGMLRVVGFDSDVFQTYEDTRGSMYKRQYNYGDWREWREIYHGNYY